MRFAVVGGMTVLVLALVLLPIVFLVRGALEGGITGVVEAVTADAVRTALWHTVTLSVVVTIAAVAGGTALALVFDRALVRHPNRWRLAVALPLLVPQFALTLSWLQAYGRGGLVDRVAGVDLPGLEGAPGIALLLTVDAVPLVWLIVSAGLAVRREPDLVRAARASGATAWRSFVTIDLPLLRGPVLAAGAVVLVGVVNSFAVPQVLGSSQGYQTLATYAYQQLSVSAAPEAFARLCVVATLMVVLVLLTVGGADRGLGRLGAGFVRGGQGGSALVHRRSTSGRLVTVALTAYLVVALAIPLLSLVATSVTRAAGLLPVPANWTLANYTEGLDAAAIAGLGRTLALAAVTAVVVCALAALVVGLGGDARRRLGTLLTLGFAVPGTALAVGVLIAYGPSLGGSAAIILVAFLGKCSALGYRAFASGADRLPPELGQAARVSGASPWTVLRTVLAPVMSSGLVAAALLVGVFAVHELTISSILYGPGTQTFAVVVLDQQQLGGIGVSAALAVVLTLPPLLVVVGAMALRARRPVLR